MSVIIWIRSAVCHHKLQSRSIDKIRPGLKLTELNDFAGRNLADGLNDQGILKCSIFEALEKKWHKDFFPHGLGACIEDNVLVTSEGRCNFITCGKKLRIFGLLPEHFGQRTQLVRVWLKSLLFEAISCVSPCEGSWL